MVADTVLQVVKHSFITIQQKAFEKNRNRKHWNLQEHNNGAKENHCQPQDTGEGAGGKKGSVGRLGGIYSNVGSKNKCTV